MFRSAARAARHVVSKLHSRVDLDAAQGAIPVIYKEECGDAIRAGADARSSWSLVDLSL